MRTELQGFAVHPTRLRRALYGREKEESVNNKFKGVVESVLGAIIAITFIIAIVIFIKGTVWASEYILPPLISVGWIVLAIDLLILLPLAISQRLRGLAGAGLFITSYLFGVICWLVGLLVAYTLWGLWAIIIGLLLLGIGVVPIGMLAAVFEGQWYMLIVLVVLAALSFGARSLGLVFLSGPASLSEEDADVGDIGEEVENQQVTHACSYKRRGARQIAQMLHQTMRQWDYVTPEQVWFHLMILPTFVTDERARGWLDAESAFLLERVAEIALRRRERNLPASPGVEALTEVVLEAEFDPLVCAVLLRRFLN
jgi:hypothetical protein